MPKNGPPKPSATATKQIGETSGLYMDGLVRSEDYNAKLTGTRAIDIYNEMRLGDATVRASLQVINLPIKSARWSVKAGEESRQADKIADIVEDELFNKGTRTWQETLSEVLLFLPFGRMPFELVWEIRPDGIVGLRKMASRWPTTIVKWKLKDGGDGIVQQTVTKGQVEIPMEKLAIFVNEKEGDNWEGISLLRSAYKHWLMKHKMYLIDAMAMERQGLGVPYAKKTGNGGPKDDDDEMDTMLENIRANEKGFMRFGSNWEVGFMDMKASTTRNPIQMVQHHDRQILVNVLGQFLSLGGGGSSGSWALSTDQSKLFLLAIESVAQYICGVFNKYVIPKMVDYNFDNVVKYPTLTYDKIGQVDFAKLMVAVMQGIQSGVLTKDGNLEQYMRDVMDLPETDGSTLVDPSLADDILQELNTEMNQLTMDEGLGLNPTPEAPEPADQNNLTPEQQTALDEQATAAASDYKKITTPQFVDKYGSEVLEVLKGGKVGVPLSDETKRKISEALKRSKSSGGSKSKSKKKAVNPEVAKKQAEVKKIQAKVKAFNDETRRNLLEMKSKGIKLSPEESAKKQLEVFDKKSVFSKQIADLKSQIDEIKSKTASPVASKKAHEHSTLPTDPGILKMSEDLENAIKNLET